MGVVESLELRAQVQRDRPQERQGERRVQDPFTGRGERREGTQASGRVLPNSVAGIGAGAGRHDRGVSARGGLSSGPRRARGPVSRSRPHTARPAIATATRIVVTTSPDVDTAVW